MSLAGFLTSLLRIGTPQSVPGSREQVRRLWRLPAPGVTVLPRLSRFWRPRSRAARRRLCRGSPRRVGVASGPGLPRDARSRVAPYVRLSPLAGRWPEAVLSAACDRIVNVARIPRVTGWTNVFGWHASMSDSAAGAWLIRLSTGHRFPAWLSLDRQAIVCSPLSGASVRVRCGRTSAFHLSNSLVALVWETMSLYL